MKIVLQRVQSASVTVEGETVGRIGRGILLLVGLGRDDTAAKFEAAIEKILHLRIFPQGDQYFHLSTRDIRGEVLLVSQFTLYGDTRKGRRPEFVTALGPGEAKPLFDRFVEEFRARYDGKVECGVFGAHMNVELLNDGPVTLIMEW